MDEYIKREEALKIIDNYSKACTVEGKVVAEAIKDIIAVITPTADVVPKSKYDLAVAEREANVKGFTEELAKAKTEVTREIFEEIDKTVFADMDFFKELKNKYTEGDNE